MGRLARRTSGERPRASGLVHARRLDQAFLGRHKSALDRQLGLTASTAGTLRRRAKGNPEHEVASYDSAQQLLAHLPQDDRPSCILLDVQIPGLSGPELQNRLSAAGPLLPIVFLTGHGDIPTSVQAIKAGAEDFLTKPVSKEVLLDAIDRAVARYLDLRSQHHKLDVLHALVAELTPRERQVFGLVVRGRLNKQIADELGMAERTVKAHRRRVMEKTKARTLVELASIAERLGMIRERG